MFEYFVSLDHSIFFFINVNLANPVTDFFMPIITSDHFLRILFAIAMVIMLWKGNKEIRWLVLFSIITLACTDITTSHFLKPIIARPRPCHTIQGLNLLVNCGAGLSMPSSHAANAFGQAMLFGLLFRRYRWWLIIFAAIIALSRVFVGVHYPGDIVFGSIVGMFFGFGMTFWYKKIVISPLKNTPRLEPGG